MTNNEAAAVACLKVARSAIFESLAQLNDSDGDRAKKYDKCIASLSDLSKYINKNIQPI